MNTVLLLAWNDVRLTVKDRGSFIWMLLFPVVLMWFFGASQGDRSSGPPRISLTVDDRDDGWLARALIDELRDEQIALHEVTEDGAEVPRVRTLVLPAGLTRKVLEGEQQTLRLEIDPDADRSFGMGAEVHVRRAIVRVLGRLLELEAGAPEAGSTDVVPETNPDEAGEVHVAPEARPPEASSAAASAGLESRYRRRLAAPTLVSLAVSEGVSPEAEQLSAGAVPGGFAQTVPGILTMIVLMMTLIYGGTFLIQEKQQGMLRRQMSLPLSRGQVVLAKLLGRLLIAALQIALLLFVARVLFGLSLGSSPAGLLMLTASYAIAVASLSILLGAVFSSVEQASTVGWLLSMVLAGLGGCWWPSEVMPAWLQSAAHVLPTAWAMDGFHALISFGRGIEGVWLPSLALLGFGALFGVLGTRFLRAV